MAWIYLAGAIATELMGTLSLRMALHRRLWYVGVALGYLTAFFLLALALAEGLPLGVAYGIWAAVGVGLTAILSRLLFKEPFTKLTATGIVLIIGGVLLVELGAHG